MSVGVLWKRYGWKINCGRTCRKRTERAGLHRALEKNLSRRLRNRPCLTRLLRYFGGHDAGRDKKKLIAAIVAPCYYMVARRVHARNDG